MTKKEETAERESALDYLRSILKPGDTVYTSLDHVSRSGMMRHIGVYIPFIDDLGKPAIRKISWEVAHALDYRRSYGGALKVSGAGMDMGYHVVYGLSRVLFDETHPFKCIGDRCPSNDHVNGDAPKANGTHSDGGYALRHAWL